VTGAVYLDSSAILRALLESGTTPAVARKIKEAQVLVTSRLSQVECARAILRLQGSPGASEAGLADAERELGALWARCELWEITADVCDLSCRVAPRKPLRTLDAIHLATFLLARKRIEGLELLSTDRRLEEAAASET
jgi:predicted nucleic acid-binding protein